ncbi:hypothetical protein TWF694_002900 [Orbilia ellipsospora]|uniref:Uncharacterized protein n=1 Tax=Orbilia ellipsospora TaxID=2528407 RepID=A0AAV9X1E0_9PEZI
MNDMKSFRSPRNSAQRSGFLTGGGWFADQRGPSSSKEGREFKEPLTVGRGAKHVFINDENTSPNADVESMDRKIQDVVGRAWAEIKTVEEALRFGNLTSEDLQSLEEDRSRLMAEPTMLKEVHQEWRVRLSTDQGEPGEGERVEGDGSPEGKGKAEAKLAGFRAQVLAHNHRQRTPIRPRFPEATIRAGPMNENPTEEDPTAEEVFPDEDLIVFTGEQRQRADDWIGTLPGEFVWQGIRPPSPYVVPPLPAW